MDVVTPVNTRHLSTPALCAKSISVSGRSPIMIILNKDKLETKIIRYLEVSIIPLSLLIRSITYGLGFPMTSGS